MVILPIVAVVAALEPLTAANIVQPTMLVCRSRPGIASTQGEMPRNMRSEMSVRKISSLIQMKSGIAASSQELAVRQKLPLMIGPICESGKSRMSTSPVMLTNIRPAKIQTPRPR